MELDKAIKLFSSFLNVVWPVIQPLLKERDYTSDEESINDWLQSNWELLVERKVLNSNEYLEAYGDGADFNGASSRITDIDSLPTHRIIVRSLSGNTLVDVLNDEKVQVNINLVFDGLVGFENGFYTNKPNFNYVLLKDEDNGVERVVLLDDVNFEIQKL
ncbi:MAG: hypothetical protein KI790_05770 [Cyclobacteriaceae bacterium]|nr:hypothetical protein [Cyclobacteriaceae bacterium HetDA_MAG_MS6]